MHDVLVVSCTICFYCAQVRASCFRLVHYMLHQVKAPAALRQIGARFACLLRMTADDVDKPSMFEGIGGGGLAAGDLVYSAYIELFRHVTHQVRQEHDRWKAQDGESCSRSSSLVFLSLLRTLAKMLTPSCLRYAAATSTSEDQSARGITDRTPTTSSADTSEKVASVCTNNPQWPGRTDRASSTSSIMQTDANAVAPSPPSTKIGALSVVATALPVLGAIIGNEGDALTRGAWDPGSGSKNASIHHAAWWALGILSTQLCLSAPASTRHANGSLGHAGQTGGRRSPGSTGKNKHAAAEGVKEWWVAVQALLSVLSSEVTRAQKRLEQLLHGRHAMEETLVATGAQQLVAGVAPLPFTVELASPELPREGEGNGEASSFWVWVPDRITQQTCASCDVDQGPGKSTTRSAKAESGWRTKIFTPVREGCSACVTNTGETGSPGVFLTWLPSDEHTPKSGSVEDGGGYHIEIFLRGIRSGSPKASNEAQGGASDETKPRVDRARTSNVAASQGDEGSGGKAVVRDRIFSECSLHMGRWTHVCCVYTNTGGEVAGSTSGSDSGRTASPSNPIATIFFNGRVVATGVSRASELGCASNTITAAQNATLRAEAGAGDRDREGTSAILTPTKGRPPALEQYQGRPVVCNLQWHARKVSQEQAQEMADNGIPAQRADEQRAAECYVTRLVALAYELSQSSPRAAAALSSPHWLSVWLKLMSVTGQHAQRAIIRLLRPLLCVPNKTTGENVEDVSGKSKLPPGRSLPARPSGHGVDDRVVVEYLCLLLGRSLLPLLHRHSGCLVGVGDGGVTSAVSGLGYRSSRLSNPVQEVSMVSELVFLLRGLIEEASTRWQDHIFSLLASGLTRAAKGELTSLSQAGATVSSKTLADSEIGAHVDQGVQTLGAALAAVYLGGGLLETPRVGATVVLLPRPDHPSVIPAITLEGRGPEETKWEDARATDGCSNICATAGKVVLAEEVTSACHGTVIGWTGGHKEDSAFHNGMLFVDVDEQHKGCLDTVSLHNVASHGKWSLIKGSQPSAVASTRRVVAAPFRRVAWQAETAEPVTPFLFDLALPDVLATLDSSLAPTSNSGTPTYHKTPGGSGVSVASGEKVVAAHLRCRLIRALAVQLRHPDHAVTALQGRMLPTLLAIATSNLASAVVVALGSDGAVAFGRRREFAAVVLALSHEHVTTSKTSTSQLADLEAACRVVWSRLSAGKTEQELPGARRTARPENTSKDVESDSGVYVRRPHPTLQVLGGEALMEGNRVTSSSHFPTIRLSDVRVGLGAVNGRWYYEVTLLTGGLMQLGWAGPLFECSPVRGQGVGDHAHSWAFDGFRQKRWCVSSDPYGKRWQAGDVVGVFLDVGLQEMRFR